MGLFAVSGSAFLSMWAAFMVSIFIIFFQTINLLGFDSSSGLDYYKIYEIHSIAPYLLIENFNTSRDNISSCTLTNIIFSSFFIIFRFWLLISFYLEKKIQKKILSE
jgi:hypothetical protein